VELFAGFFLDSFGISLQLIDLLGVPIVFFLQLADLLLQILILGTFGPINHHPIGAEHDVHKQPYREHRHRSGGQPPAYPVYPFDNRLRLGASSCGPRFSLIGALGERTQPRFRRRKNPDLRELYSKIHCFAAAFRSCKPCWLGASEYTLTTGSVPESR